MIARAGRERPGWKKVAIYIEIPLKKVTILIAQAGKELKNWQVQESILILGGKAYKNLRRKGGEKYREVYLRWVAKPIEKSGRNPKKNNKKC